MRALIEERKATDCTLNKLVETDCWHKHSQAKEKIGTAVIFFKWSNIQPRTISKRQFSKLKKKLIFTDHE